MSSKGSLNKVMLIGNLGADPELRSIPDGSSVVNFTLATTEVFTDRNNPTAAKQERTEWHRISFFGRSAEVIHEYARKGSKLYVEGTLTTRKWQDKEGNDRWTTEIRGFRFTFLGGGRDGGGEGGGSSSGGGNRPGEDNFSDMDDVPF